MINKRTLEEDCFGITKTRNTINSKRKGNSGERAAAKYLGEWVGVKFTRTPQSGAIRKVNTEGVVADIIPDTLDTNFKWDWVVETKHLKSITIKRTLSTSSHIFKIWQQVASDANRAIKLPMALLRENKMPAGEYYIIFEAGLGGRLMALNVPILFSGGNHEFSLIGFLFSDVKKHCPYALFDRAIKSSLIIGKSKLIID